MIKITVSLTTFVSAFLISYFSHNVCQFSSIMFGRLRKLL